MTKLYPYQEEAVKFGLDHHYILNASEMGTGKTLMALETAKRAGGDTLVFGPAFLKHTWQAEADKAGHSIFYIPYSLVHRIKASALRRYSFWIADEIHYLKNPTTNRTHGFYSLLKDVVPNYFLGLTGTPIRNRVPDFWTLIGFCGVNPKNTNGKRLEGDLKKYRAFSRYFCKIENLKIRGRYIEKFVGIREDKVEEFKGLLREKYIRFRVEDVLKDLPDITYKEVELKATVAGVEDLWIREAFTQYIAGSKVDVSAKATSALIKAPQTAEYCNCLLDNESGPLVIFSDHVDSASVIHSKIPGSLLVTGQTAMDSRNAAVMRFQTGVVPALVATIGSMSVGVTLTASRHVVFNDLSWVPSDNAQAEKRIHRIGQKQACFVHYIDSTPTDKYIRRTLKQKLEAINRLT